MNASDLLAAHRVAVARALVRHFSHELVQPLTALVNYVEVGNTRGARAEPGGDAHRALFQAMQGHADEAVACLRRFGRALEEESRPAEPFDVNAAVREAVQFMNPEARRAGISISLDLASGLRPVAGHKSQVSQAFVEILCNSLESIAAAPGNRREVAIGSGPTPTGGVEVRVADTGAGFGGAARERIFEAFYTTRPGRTGLGLAAVRAAVEAHGGEVSAMDNDSSGVTVLLEIPTE